MVTYWIFSLYVTIILFLSNVHFEDEKGLEETRWMSLISDRKYISVISNIPASQAGTASL
jgi:hypothetical protein